MERADTALTWKGNKKVREKAPRGALRGDASSKSQLLHRLQSLSGEKTHTVSTKGEQGTRVPLRQPSYSDLEATLTSNAHYLSQSSPVPASVPVQSFAESHQGSHAAPANVTPSSEAGQIELLRVRSLILEAGYDFPDLRGQPGETAEEAVLRLLDRHRKLSQDLKLHSVDSDSLKEQKRKELATLQDKLRYTQAELFKLREEQRVSASARTANADMLRQIHKLDEMISTLQFQNAELASAHASELKKVSDEFKAEQHKAMRSFQERAEDEKMRWTARIHDLKAEHQSRMETQDRVADTRLKEEEHKHAQELEFRLADSNKRIQVLETQLRQQETELLEAQKSHDLRRADEQRWLDKELRQQEESLKVRYESEQNRLRSAVEHLKGALVAKEHFRGLTDAELTSRFAKLAQEVEDFARLEWLPAREAEWLTPQLQQLQPRNSRKLKQAVIQNSMWIGLREHVFRSPFRFFEKEDEWKESNAPWVEIYALKIPPSSWPKLSRDVEKSRYETAKQLRGAVDSSAKSETSEQLTKLRMTYEKSLSFTVCDIAPNIAKVAALKDKELKVLRKIVQLSVELWLECCSQRYRLMVALEEGIEDVLATSQRSPPSLKLVLKPQLRKFGNAHGDRVDIEEPMAGWRSAVETYPSQRVVST